MMIFWSCNAQTNERDLHAIMYATIFTHRILRSSSGNKNSISGTYMKRLTEYDGTPKLDMQPRKHMPTMEKVNTPDLMVIVRWIANLSPPPIKPEWVSLILTPPYISELIKQGNREN